MKKTHYRSIFISDIHLGFRGCRAEELTKWLKHVECDYLYLLGDCLDIWSLQSKFYFPESHIDLTRALLKLSKKTKRTVFTPGNHDWIFKLYNGTTGNFTIANEYIHVGLDGQEHLVLHGDKHDGVLAGNKFLVHLGCVAYDILLAASTRISQARKAAGRVHWSLSKYLKQRVKTAVNYIGAYEEHVVADARAHGVTSIICGHIHHAGILQFQEITYMNTGDWVESLSCIVEHPNGQFEVLTPFN